MRRLAEPRCYLLFQSMASLDIELPQSWLPLPEKDTRVDGWLLLGNPAPILSILACYVYVVRVSVERFNRFENICPHLVHVRYNARVKH